MNEWPGRWYVGPNDPNEQKTVLSEGGSLIAVVCHECVMPPHELHKNAKLIAAAPDLLALVERAIVICCEAERRGHKDLEVMYIYRGEPQLFRKVAQEIADEIQGPL